MRVLSVLCKEKENENENFGLSIWRANREGEREEEKVSLFVATMSFVLGAHLVPQGGIYVVTLALMSSLMEKCFGQWL